MDARPYDRIRTCAPQADCLALPPLQFSVSWHDRAADLLEQAEEIRQRPVRDNRAIHNPVQRNDHEADALAGRRADRCAAAFGAVVAPQRAVFGCWHRMARSYYFVPLDIPRGDVVCCIRRCCEVVECGIIDSWAAESVLYKTSVRIMFSTCWVCSYCSTICLSLFNLKMDAVRCIQCYSWQNDIIREISSALKLWM